MELIIDDNINKGIALLVDRRYCIFRHVFLQIIILLISVGIFFDTPDTLNISFNRFCGWVTYYLFMNMLIFVNIYILFPRFLAKSKIIQYIAAVGLFTFFALFILMILQDSFYDIAVSHHDPGLMAIFLSLSSSFLAILLFIGGVSTLLLFKQLMQKNIREQELKIATTESELKFLKSQINPHFLFNTINNANILVDDDPEIASGILIKLDDLLKYQLEDSHKEKVRIKDDIRFLTDYLDLEKIRRDQFEYIVETKGNIDNVFIAPLLFIPFVENAVKHNSDNRGSSYINLSFTLANNKLTFICENSKPANPTRQTEGGIGLVNISRRLNLLYENSYSLEKYETDYKYIVKLILEI